MCSRYSLASDLPTIAKRFAFDAGDVAEMQPRYNIAPTQEVLTVVERDPVRPEPVEGRHAANRAILMRWGLVPFWSKGLKDGPPMINARSEEAASKPAFREAIKRRRCLVIADGFYEWRKEGKTRIPLRITLKSREPFAMAGLWETWRSPEGQIVKSCCILTTPANELVAAIHDRMPVILPDEAEPLWLDPEQQDGERTGALLRPFLAGSLAMYEVSPVVNAWQNDTPECIQPAAKGQRAIRPEPVEGQGEAPKLF